MGQLNLDEQLFFDRLGGRLSPGLDRAAEAIARRMRNLVDTPFPPASRPGNPPHKRSGNLQDKIQVVKSGPLSRQIGSAANYAIYLELGTGERASDIRKTKNYRPGRRQGAGMYRRPFVVKSLMQSKSEIRREMSTSEPQTVA